ncbi:hypothetical protein [Nodosilinea sp. FACHB-13]|uniref:hypothetical protein n=1 Tax=Cyanophyceae TaxID=3028117 RepID=UPI001687E347|nr:hypothetical protein [Nodosilinea sp. FACHB-13]MBD2107051.1 hypothetical protein [Nodosilinea sp. FACHB-13]
MAETTTLHPLQTNTWVKASWMVNTAGLEVIAFEVAEGHNGCIETSQALPNLKIVLVNKALGRSAAEDNSTIERCLLAQFGNPNL